MRELYGDVVRYWLGPKLVVILSDPDDAEVLFRDTQNINKSDVYKLLEPWLGQGLVTSGGHKWHLRRKAIAPTFHFTILQKFIEVFQTQTDVFIKRLTEKANGKVFDIHPSVSEFALDVICETAMGVSVNAQSNGAAPYVKSVKMYSNKYLNLLLYLVNFIIILALLNSRICDEVTNRISKFWLHPNILFKLSGKQTFLKRHLSTVHGFANEVIMEQAKRREEENTDKKKGEDELGIKKKTAFLKLLLKMKEDKNMAFLSIDDLREEVDTFMFAGYDTTASAISFAIHSLGKHPEVQAKAYKEVYEWHGKISGPLTIANLHELKYLDCVIKETLRRYPSVPLVAREISNDVILPSGYKIPSGSILAVAIGGIHHNQKHYTNPYDFDPDRFLPENIAQRHPYAFVPFSAGSRNCLGQKFAVLEMKIALSQILLHFEIGAGEDVLPGMVLTLQSDNGNQVSLSPRNK